MLVFIPVVHIHREPLCPPTCGDPTHCRDSCRMGGRRGARGGRRVEVRGGGQGGRVPSFCRREGKMRKRGAETDFLSRHKQPLRHILLTWIRSAAEMRFLFPLTGPFWQLTHCEGGNEPLLYFLPQYSESRQIGIHLIAKLFKKFAFLHFCLSVFKGSLWHFFIGINCFVLPIGGQKRRPF